MNRTTETGIRTAIHTVYSPRRGGLRRPLWLRMLLTLLLTFLLTMPGLLFAAASASLDRQTIYAGDTATLRISTSGDDAGEQPDLRPLKKDFDVLGTSTSTQIQIINGQRSDKHEWLVELAPRGKGAITIPSLSVGNSQTAALTLQVSEQPAAATAQAGQPVFMRAEINPTQGDHYVQQQILYTTRLYYRVPLVEASFSKPSIDNAVVEQLGDDAQYDTTINGQRYQVVERRYAIFPERSGQLTISPTVFSGRMVSASDRQSPFGRMDSMMQQMLNRSGMSDPFFGGTPFGDPGKRLRLSSNTLSLDIKPRPASYQGGQWLPTQKLVLQDSWASAPPVIHAGEPVTRSLTLEAKGLEASQLPDLKLPGSDKLRVYPEQPTLTNRTDGDWIFGRSEQGFAYVASQPGKLHFPAVQVSWWNTLTHQQQNTVLPALDVTVLPGTGQSAATPTAASSHPTTAPAGVATAASAATETGNATKGATQNATAPGTGPAFSLANLLNSKDQHLYRQLGGGLAVVLLVVLGVALLLVIARWFMRRRQQPTPAQPAAANTQIAKSGEVGSPPAMRSDNSAAVKRSRQALRDACANNNPQAAADALLAWAAVSLPEPPPRSLGALAVRVKQGADAIRELESVLYGANHQTWFGQTLWEAFSAGLLTSGKSSGSITSPAEGVPSLYPDWHKQAS